MIEMERMAQLTRLCGEPDPESEQAVGDECSLAELERERRARAARPQRREESRMNDASFAFVTADTLREVRLRDRRRRPDTVN